MIIEIYKPTANEYGSTEKAIKAKAFTIWTDERIKKAFNFGNGTQKDFDEYKRNNSAFCYYRNI